MNNENKLVPKLRFPEFTEEWEEVSLKEVAKPVKRKKDTISDNDNVLTISANNESLEFEIDGHSDMEFRMSVKALFSTLDDVVLATYSYGIYKGDFILST